MEEESPLEITNQIKEELSQITPTTKKSFREVWASCFRKYSLGWWIY